ncbi:MAG: outer membrane beta-barrel protein [Bacteriovoracaceae bacterium]|nr:outer membrane beta-barrel protein [Bacteriovoracaceae bacterium]
MKTKSQSPFFSILFSCSLSLLLLKAPPAFSRDDFAKAPDTSEESGNESSGEEVGKVFKKNNSSSNSSSSSGLSSNHGIGIGIGQTFLLGDYSHHGSDDLTADLFYRYKASHSFDLLTNFHTSTQKDNEDLEKMELMALTTGIKAKYFDFDNFSPFLLGGLGFYRPKATRIINGALTESENKIVLGVHLGAGMELNLNKKFSFGLQGIYHYPFRSKQNSQPSLAGSYFKLMMALFYNF